MRLSLSPAHARTLYGTAILIAVTGCASLRSDPTDADARPASDAPAQFDGTTPAPGCRSPLTDPRDGTVLRLVRSTEDRGDYDVPAGRYGVLPGELLRVDCTDGAVIGIVRR